VRYRFTPLERRGVIAGWRGGQIATVAAGLVAGVFGLRTSPSVAGVLVALVSVAAAVAFAFWPVFGRTGDQWLPLGVRWLWVRGFGDGRQHAPGPGHGHRLSFDLERSWSGGPGLGRGDGAEDGTGASPGSGGVRYRMGPPVRPAGRGSRRSVFTGLTVVGVPFGPGSSPTEVGVVIDGPSRTATAVLAVQGHSFALLGPSDQDARIAAWARVLSAMAREGSTVHRIQWIESCLPDDGSSVRDHWATHAVLGADTPAGRSYRALVDEAAPVTRRHRVLLSLSIHTSHSSRSIRTAGRGLAGIGAVLGREVVALHRALDGADVSVVGVLGPSALARVFRDTYAPTNGATGHVVSDPDPDPDPDGCGRAGPGLPPGPTDHTDRPDLPDYRAGYADTAGPAEGGGPGGRSTGPSLAHPTVPWPWPMGVEPHWDAVRTDATWHATYWIAEWPRVDVTPDFLGPVLFSPLRRSVVMVMEPVSPTRAARQVAQARTADIADGELRRRGGFLVTARQTREREGVEDRDAELADGHAQFRFSGYVTLTADTRPELEAARAALEQAAGQARIELRLLFGEQDTAFACSLPLGRGLS
jgi:hypothetical protein